MLDATGTMLRGLRDHHVHLGLVDVDLLTGSVLSAVDDLGWTLDQALAWRRTPPAGLCVRVAGPFLTAPGGYPSGRSWAPQDAVVAIGSVRSAVEAVGRLVRAGVDSIKVVLHTGMPLLGDHELTAVIDAAHQLGRPVIAHVEGAGQTARALAVGVDVLAHTPWTERLPDEVITALSRRMIMISSLAIHAEDEESYDIAVDNLARFHAAGGQIRYGTDLGNGGRRPGLDPAELAGLVAAGLDVAALLDAIAVVDDLPGWVTWSPYPIPGSVTESVDWFATARRIAAGELERYR